MRNKERKKEQQTVKNDALESGQPTSTTSLPGSAVNNGTDPTSILGITGDGPDGLETPTRNVRCQRPLIQSVGHVCQECEDEYRCYKHITCLGYDALEHILSYTPDSRILLHMIERTLFLPSQVMTSHRLIILCGLYLNALLSQSLLHPFRFLQCLQFKFFWICSSSALVRFLGSSAAFFLYVPRLEAIGFFAVELGLGLGLGLTGVPKSIFREKFAQTLRNGLYGC